MVQKKSTKKHQDLDSPQTTILRRKILQRKFFLREIYKKNYQRFATLLSDTNRNGYIVELGSGAGFIKDIIPHAVTSDILQLPIVDMHFSAVKMPFAKGSVNAFLMIDVFHHIDDVEKFLKEANRCLKPGGEIIMIEPANTLWGRCIWKYFHHEPYNPKSTWSFVSHGPLSSSNSALPWIVFYRDRDIFQKKFPTLSIVSLASHTPIKYLVSGGFSFPQLLPNFFNPLIDLTEFLLTPLYQFCGLFSTIHLVKEKK